MKQKLRNIPLFGGLGDGELSVLRGILLVDRFREGEVIVSEGDARCDLFVITRGRASVSTTRKNSLLSLGSFSAGEYFGELGFLDGKPRTGTVRADEDTEVLIVPREAFMRLFPDGSAVAMSLARTLGMRMRGLMDRLDVLSMLVSKEELHEADLDTVCRLVNAMEYSDLDTGAHLSRMGAYSRILAEAAGLSPDDARSIGEAAPLHDIGKIGIPGSILRKPGRLTREETALVRTHPLIGARILSNPRSYVMVCAREIALYHHEKYDGSGYPHFVKGIYIPQSARIVALADAFDALTSDRPYRKAVSAEKALEVMKEGRGSHFDPVVFDVFERSIEEMTGIWEEAQTGG